MVDLATLAETLLSLLVTLAMGCLALGFFLAAELDRREREIAREDRAAAARARANARHPQEDDHV
jgi:hypothetical protein